MKATEFLQKLKNLKQTDLDNIRGLGPILSQNFIEFTNSPRFERLMQNFQKLEQKGIELQIQSTAKPALNQTNLPLSKETICITGSFDIPRPEIKEKLEALGAKVTDSVTSSTTILIAGEKAGSKLAKAEKLGIKVISDYNLILQ